MRGKRRCVARPDPQTAHDAAPQRRNRSRAEPASITIGKKFA